MKPSATATAFALAVAFLSVVCPSASGGIQLVYAADTSSPPQSPLTNSPVITSEVSSFIRHTLDAAAIPGLSMGIVRLGRSNDSRTEPIVELATWGNRTEAGDGNDLTPDTLFALASCSKAFLVTSVGLIIDDYANGRNVTALPPGLVRLDWDTKLAHLLPGEWGLRDEWADVKLDLHDAFSHMSGIPRNDFSYRPGDTAIDVLQRLRVLPPAYELREQWSYNNQMFMVGAHLVERFSGMSYAAFVSSRLFTPLNMSSTTLSPSTAADTGKLTETWTRGSRRIPFWFPDDVAGLFAGPGGIISSAADMTKWLAVLLNGGVDPQSNTVIIPPTTFAAMTTASAIVSGTPSVTDTSILGYGMGWFRMSYRGYDLLYHDGAIPGFSLLTAFLPSENFAAVLLANVDEKLDDNMNILFRVTDEALGLPPSTTNPDTTQPEDPPTSSSSTEHLPLDITAYAGTYEDAAYGRITLCAATDTSPHCLAVLSDFAPIEQLQVGPAQNADRSDTSPADPDPVTNVATNTTTLRTTSYPSSPLSSFPPSATRLYAAWPRVWSTHARLEHTDGPSFAVLFPALFPAGFGADRTPFAYWDSQNSVARAVFALEPQPDAASGTPSSRVVAFALITDEQAAAARARRSGASLREIGDAWFVKVR